MSKRNSCLIYSAGFLFFITACTQPAREPEHKPVPIERLMESNGQRIQIDPTLLVSLRDAICGMSLKDGISDTLTRNDKIYGFCSPGCKESFIKKTNSQ